MLFPPGRKFRPVLGRQSTDEDPRWLPLGLGRPYQKQHSSETGREKEGEPSIRHMSRLVHAHVIRQRNTPIRAIRSVKTGVHISSEK